MALVATAVGPDHFVGAVSIPVSLMSCASGRGPTLVRQVVDARPVCNGYSHGR